jgi:tellurite resistance protein
MSYPYSTTDDALPFHDMVSRGERYPDGFVDAVIAAGALTACADGSVHPVERLEMLVYMRRAGLSLLRRRDVLEIFDQRVRALQHDPTSATQATLGLLGNFLGSGLAWTVLRAAEHVAAADSRMQDSELIALRSVRAALGLPTDSLGEPLSA